MKRKLLIMKSSAIVIALSVAVAGIYGGSSELEAQVVSKAVSTSVLDTSMPDKGLMITDDDERESDVKESDIESDYVVADVDTALNVRSSASEDADVVGRFYNGNVGTLIEQNGDWSLISSGNVYGYVKSEYILSGDKALDYIEDNCNQIARVTTDTLNIRHDTSVDCEIVAISGEGDSLDVIDVEADWIHVAVDTNVTGYVASDYVNLDYEYETAKTLAEDVITVKSEDFVVEDSMVGDGNGSATTPDESGNVTETTGQENDAPIIYGEVAVSELPEPTTISTLGQDIANFAIQFVGNPYRYGGTSLTDGADCSGFVYAVYANFGYSLPRSSYDQANVGRQVSVSDLKPGDLIFYRDFGHVALYVGNNQVVHASTPETGIKYSAYNYSTICRVVRIVD